MRAMRKLLLFSQCLFLFSWGVMMSNGAGATNAPSKMVILGASYAGGWGQPALPGYEIVNRGAGGEETSQMRARFERDVLTLQPSVVLIWGHINNIHRAPRERIDAAVDAAKADYRAMVDSARAANIRVILATEVTLSEAIGFTNRLAAFVGRLRGKQGYSAYINGHVRDINAWLRIYAREQNLQLLDLERVFDDGEGYRKAEYSSDDGTHINAAGYAALTAYAQGALRAP
jgi:lysophospholipase L1-like esterase